MMLIAECNRAAARRWMGGRTGNRNWLALFLLALLSSSAALESAERKVIQLRNERIETIRGEGVRVRQAARAEPGLFLVQFNGPLARDQRTQVEDLGVRLLRAVPEHAFVARFRGAALGKLRDLPFVHWVGRYRPEHKIEASLLTRGGARDGLQSVQVLIGDGLPEDEIVAVRRILARVTKDSTSLGGHVLAGTVDEGDLLNLARSPAVLWIEPMPAPRLLDEISTKIVAGDDGQLGTGTVMHQLGFDGTGVVVAVADSGLASGDASSMHPDLAGRVDAFFYYGELTSALDGHGHGTHVAGIVAGNGAAGLTDSDGARYGLGVAPGAHLIAQRIFDSNGDFISDPPSWDKLARDAVQAGADIGSNSWGEAPEGRPGRYDITAAEFDALVRDADSETPGDQPYILEFSAGNIGPGTRTIYTPALAKNVIATGASENNRFDMPAYDGFSPIQGSESVATFSSRGPCEDGRIKPDVVAPGTWIASLKSASAPDPGGVFAGTGSISPEYMYQTGTSQAGPHVSGAAAVFVQYYRERAGTTPSPALVKAALIHSAVDMDDAFGTGPVPNDAEGWGRVDLTTIIESDRHLDYVDQETPLATDQLYERRVFVNGEQPLKVTLTYTDAPGFPPAIPALVNDLDLEVVAPFGQVFRGNQFERGESVAGSERADNINNVEGIFITAPVPGDYIIRVRAGNVVEDSRRDTPEIDQDFALAISSVVPFPGMGFVGFDQPAYTAPDEIRVRLVDPDLAGQSQAEVLVTSSSHPEGILMVLLPGEQQDVFVGTLQTIPFAEGAPVTEALPIRHGDLIQAVYEDASPAQTQRAEAQADLQAPIISGVSASSMFGSTQVSWLTDEPAKGTVEFGRDSALGQVASEAFFAEEHVVMLRDLLEESEYLFRIRATDAAGNEAVADNGGSLFRFVAPKRAAVLLVDAFFDDFFFPDPPPISNYTDPLDQLNVSYEVWSVEQLGSPALADLQPFQIVMWRLPEASLNRPTLTADEQEVLRKYLGGGGSLFIASMEILSRLEEAGSQFGRDILQVQSYIEDVGVGRILGSSRDTLTRGIDMELSYQDYVDFDSSDVIVPTTNAVPILHESVEGKVVGLRAPRVGQESAGRVAFLSFPFDAVPATGADPNSRTALLQRILQFLAPGMGGLGSVAIDNSIYTIPALVTVEVADSDLAGGGRITAQAFSETTPEGITIELSETIRRGLFRGSFTLVSSTTARAGDIGQLKVSPSDEVRVEYWDESSQGVARAYATLDIEAPIISGVTVEPSYQSAVVKWTSHEPSDSLVPFGETRILTRNGFDPALTTTHAVELQGLSPDHVYYFQTISRDEAGNSAIEDNNGEYYQFRTLAPEMPPWLDSFESNNSRWEVVNNVRMPPNQFALAFSPVGWTLGTPSNGREDSAFSPANAWGSNLTGSSTDGADSLLLSPAIKLEGGNVATLRFHHSYDFTRSVPNELVSQEAVVYATENSGEDLQLLATVEGKTEGWEPIEIDLTAYIGKSIRIGFYYGFLSFEEAWVPGWLIDDVSVSLSSVAIGTIHVHANLSQAEVVLSGPTDRQGEGMTNQFAGLPAGEYTVTFQPVPYYITPDPVQVTLAAAGAVTATGIYEFLDTNKNAISDAWEEHWFGLASPDRTSLTDSDADGASDHAEFLAGTDPTSAGSRLALALELSDGPDGARLTWQTMAGYSYRLFGSENLQEWEPLRPWERAGSNPTSRTVDITLGKQTFFKLEARP